MNKVRLPIKTFILIVLLQFAAFGNDLSIQSNRHEKVQEILYREEMDLDAKSIKGWIRVVNSKSKMKNYAIHLNPEEKKLILIYLQGLYTNEYNKYSKVVR